MDELNEAKVALATAERERDAALAEAVALKEERAARDTEVARLREGAMLRETRDIVAATLAKVERLPDVTRARLAEAISANPPIKDGALDKDALGKRIEETVKAEVAYLAEVTGGGRIIGMGGTTDSTDATQEALESAFSALMGDDTLAKIAANGRN